MSTSDRTRGDIPIRPDTTAAPPGAVPPPAPGPASADPYSGWLERMQRGRGRHAAITRNLGSIASYRSWADRMKGSFDEERKAEVAAPAPAPLRR